MIQKWIGLFLGFVNLDAADEYKKGPKQYLVDEGYIAVAQDDYVSSTTKGSIASENDDNKDLATDIELQ
ncbi:MAG: hypothetical protein UY04_C0046G0004 [Parcubacteria group bacterium GW2011_GWA2_47_7]|nr:MAG: hypothetical protein UY04_C0046G0004 [Parcubacteria group bacterium GW2011_GWA2_47_7]